MAKPNITPFDAVGMIVMPKRDPILVTSRTIDRQMVSYIHRPCGPMETVTIGAGDSGVLAYSHAPVGARVPNRRATWMLRRLDGTGRSDNVVLRGPVAFLATSPSGTELVKLGWPTARAHIEADDALARGVDVPDEALSAYSEPVSQDLVRLDGLVFFDGLGAA